MKFWYEKPLGQALLGSLQNPAPPQRRSAPIHTHASRMYASARSDRLISGWQTSNSSADSELVTSLTQLRTRSRALVRDASYAKRARVCVVNNVIGSGIGMQAQVLSSRDTLSQRINDDIESVWEEWADAENCHTGGRLAFAMFERACMAQVFDAGEVFVRIHLRKFGSSNVPLALELIEAERIADELTSPFLAATTGNEVRMGVEVNEFHRPVAYFIRRRHPSEFRFSHAAPDQVERVPAENIIHLALIDRWPQTRGEPWLHTAARRLNDMDGYSEAEITRARVQACTAGAIETPESAESFGEQQDDGSVIMEVEPGVYKRLAPGEKLVPGQVTAPNPALDPFMRYMLREVSAGAGPSYSSISRDYSQANYSSERVAQLDDRDLWRFFQSWFIRDLRYPVHRLFIRQGVLSGAIASIPPEQYGLNVRKFERVLFKPRGWSWVDPTKEVEAYKEAIKAGFTTRTDVIAATAGGQDVEDIDATRERELNLAKEKGLKYDTDPEFYMSDAAKAQAEAKSIAKASAKPKEDPPQQQSLDLETDPPQRRVFSFPRK